MRKVGLFISTLLFSFLSLAFFYSFVGLTCSYGGSEEFIVGFSGSFREHYFRIANLVREYGGEIKNVIRIKNQTQAVIVSLPTYSAGTFLEAVRRTVGPDFIENNNVYKACFVPNDIYWSRQWGMKKIEADFAWNTSIGNSSIVVAVIDTGVDWNHPDLAGNYIALGYDWVNDDPDPMDDNGHGTHVAGIVAAVINNSIGVAGLAQVRIMAEKALNSTGYGDTDDLANAIIHAVDVGARIIVMSWGDYYDSILLHNAIKYAYRNGVLLVAAAGNDAVSEPIYPAAYSEVIAVSATNSIDGLAWFSNFGDWIELSAPGVDIFSTIWDDSYAYESGTSMAAPFVAGVAALTWSVYPEFSRDELRLYLRERTDDLGSPGFDIYFGYGRVNAKKAVENSTGKRDIAIISVSPRKTVVGQGMRMRVDVNVTNFGDGSESFKVALYANTSEVNYLACSLQGGQSMILTFQWNTTGFNFGKYMLGCYVDPLPEELNTSNNFQNSGQIVWVAMVGDITSSNPDQPDGKVNIRDIALVASLYGASFDSFNWDPNADINDDDKIDIEDLSLVASNFGKSV